MESRKAWRNRDASTTEGVLALLEALAQGWGAQGIGLFDDDRAEPNPDDGPGALNFWDAFSERPCADIDWASWYRELRLHERVETACGCGAGHRVRGFLIHGRWALLLVAAPTMTAVGAATIASSLRALADRLPPARTAEERALLKRYEAEPDAPLAPAHPAHWVRKLPQ
ncbi:MAG TPA: hypothetical protein VHU40_06060 [Polyangia bacterium]|nr:hypothetical protein [Polyangia bacterium]